MDRISYGRFRETDEGMMTVLWDRRGHVARQTRTARESDEDIASLSRGWERTTKCARDAMAGGSLAMHTLREANVHKRVVLM